MRFDFMKILRAEGHQQNALLQLTDDLRFTGQKSLACGARLLQGRSENDEAILKRTTASDRISLHKMDEALADSLWLVGTTFSMADIAMAPYVNRLYALSMEGLWRNGRLPRVEHWFERVKERPTFKPAFLDWMPADLSQEMRSNGEKSWPEIRAIISP